MNKNIPLAAALVALPLIGGGCVATYNPPDAEADASLAAGQAIAFHADPQPLNAADPAGPTLTLAEAVRRTLANSPAVQSALARVRVAEAEARQTRLLPNPVLSVAVRFPDGGGPTVIESALSEDFIALLTRPNRVTAADNRLRSVAGDAVAAVLDVLSELQQAYVGAQSLDALLPVLEQNLALQRRLLELAEGRRRAGEGDRLEETTLRAQLAETNVLLTRRRLDRREARLTLTRLIGEPSGAAGWALPPFQPVALPDVGERAWVAAALEKRPEVVVQTFALTALGDDVNLARIGRFAGGDAGIDASRDDGDWSVGPGGAFPLPLFDLGGTELDRRRALVIEARHELTRLRRQIVEEVRRAYATLEASADALQQARDELVPLSQQRRGPGGVGVHGRLRRRDERGAGRAAVARRPHDRTGAGPRAQRRPLPPGARRRRPRRGVNPCDHSPHHHYHPRDASRPPKPPRPTASERCCHDPHEN